MTGAVRGERSETADMALRLARFANTARFRLNLRAAYDLATGEVHDGERIASDVGPAVAHVAMSLTDRPLCPLCGRLIVPEPSVSEHHLVPRRYKGTETVILHRVCHNKIHAVLTEREPHDRYHTVERLRDRR